MLFMIFQGNDKEQNRKSFSDFLPIFNAKFSNFYKNERFYLTDIEDGVLIHNRFGNYNPRILEEFKDDQGLLFQQGEASIRSV
jgi:hypothetical protein